MKTVDAFSLAVCLFVTLGALWHIDNKSPWWLSLSVSALASLQLFLGLT